MQLHKYDYRCTDYLRKFYNLIVHENMTEPNRPENSTKQVLIRFQIDISFHWSVLTVSF